MPSKESQVLSDVYTLISQRQQARPDMSMDELRTLSLELEKVSVEPTNVTYEESLIGNIPAIWVKPVGAPRDRVILYCHGGGFSMLSAATHRKFVGHLAKAANAQALIPDYRLAPEHVFPAQIDDCAACYHWLLEQGVKQEKIAIAGDSAGGNLCIAVPLKLIQDGFKPPAAVVSFSPFLDLEVTGGTVKSNAATETICHEEGLKMMAATYLAGTSPQHPLANPLHADLKAFPPLFLACGTHETLQDDSVRFAEKARKAGVPVVLEEAEGMQHVYPFIVGRAPEADKTMASAGKFLTEQLGK